MLYANEMVYVSREVPKLEVVDLAFMKLCWQQSVWTAGNVKRDHESQIQRQINLILFIPYILTLYLKSDTCTIRSD
jgi:hypothetical protein